LEYKKSESPMKNDPLL